MIPLYVSGFPPFDSQNGKVVDAPIGRQTELVLEQMKLCVKTRDRFGKHPEVQCALHEKLSVLSRYRAGGRAIVIAGATDWRG